MAPPAAATALQKAKILSAAADIPEDSKTEALVMIASILLDQAGRAGEQVHDRDAALDHIAAFMPAPRVGQPIPQAVRNVFDEVLIIFVPRARPQEAVAPNNQNQQQIVAANLNVEIASEKQRWITVGGVKMPRNPQRPYDALYPHAWIDKEFHMWQKNIDTVLATSSISELHRFKLNRQLDIVEQWFLLLPAGATPETLPVPLVRIFLAAIECILEVFLLGCRNTGTTGTATSAFHAAVDGAYHSNTGIDYFLCLKTARAEKDPPKSHKDNRDFRSNNSDIRNKI